jgi:hypothetical protein
MIAVLLSGMTVLAPAAAEPRSRPNPVAEAGLESVLGREVSNLDGDGGRVIDVLADADGKLRAAVIEFGGFLGIGTRKIAIDWSALRFTRDGGRIAIVVEVRREQLRNAPEYKGNEAPVVVKSAAD